MIFPQTVRLREVGPRINFENELTVEQKLEWIHLLAESGLPTIEVSSFFARNREQFKEAAELVLKLKRKTECNYSVLVPNKRGLTRAFVVDADEVNFFIATSESYNQLAKNAKIKDSIHEIKKMASESMDYQKHTCVFIATAFGCPIEGNMNTQKTLYLANQLLDLGINEISFCDSIGNVTPPQIQLFLEDLLKEIPVEKCSMQFNNTYGRGLSNVFTALSYGIERFDSVNGGFGAERNANVMTQLVATEDIVSLLNHTGVYTGIDELKLHVATKYIVNELNETPNSKLFFVLTSKKHPHS